jgi:hypothetical protein
MLVRRPFLCYQPRLQEALPEPGHASPGSSQPRPTGLASGHAPPGSSQPRRWAGCQPTSLEGGRLRGVIAPGCRESRSRLSHHCCVLDIILALLNGPLTLGADPAEMVRTAEQHSVLTTAYETVASDERASVDQRAAFARKANWHRVLARIAAERGGRVFGCSLTQRRLPPNSGE